MLLPLNTGSDEHGNGCKLPQVYKIIFLNQILHLPDKHHSQSMNWRDLQNHLLLAKVEFLILSVILYFLSKIYRKELKLIDQRLVRLFRGFLHCTRDEARLAFWEHTRWERRDTTVWLKSYRSRQRCRRWSSSILTRIFENRLELISKENWNSKWWFRCRADYYFTLSHSITLVTMYFCSWGRACREALPAANSA